MLLKFAIEDFLEDRILKNVSQETVKGYKLCLVKFAEFLSNHLNKVNVEEISVHDIKSYIRYRRNELNNNPTTIHRNLTILRVFFSYLVQCGYIQKNPAKEITRPKLDIKIQAFEDYHIKQMLSYYRRLKQKDKTFWAYRDYTIIIFLLGTGVRRGELINVKWSDIDFINNKIVVFGKARKQRAIPMNEKLKSELLDWKAFCEKYFGFLPDFVFVERTGKQLTSNSVKLVFKRLKQKMNFKDVRLSPHTFRHTFAKNWIMAGGDVFSLQRILGHTTLDMTNRYVSLFGSALNEQNDKFNPLNRIEF